MFNGHSRGIVIVGFTEEEVRSFFGRWTNVWAPANGACGPMMDVVFDVENMCDFGLCVSGEDE